MLNLVAAIDWNISGAVDGGRAARPARAGLLSLWLAGAMLLSVCWGGGSGAARAQEARPVAAQDLLRIRGIRYEQPAEGLGRVVIDYSGASDRVDIRRVGDEMVMEFEGAVIADKLLGSHTFDSPTSPVDTLQVARLADRIQMVVVQRVGVRKVSNFQSNSRYVLGFEQGFEKLFPTSPEAVRQLPNDDSRTRVRNVIVDRSPSGSTDWVVIEFSDAPDVEIQRAGEHVTVTIQDALLPERLATGILVPDWAAAIQDVKARDVGGAVELTVKLRPGEWEVENFLRGNQLVLVLAEPALAKSAVGSPVVLSPVAASAADELGDDAGAAPSKAPVVACVPPPRQRKDGGANKRNGAAPKVFRDCPTCPTMRTVPAGAFDMGSSDSAAIMRKNESPKHRVALPAFAVSQHEVTWGEFRAFVRATGRPLPGSCRAWDVSRNAWANIAGLNWEDPGYPQTENHPAVCVSWEDARAFAAWLTATTGQNYRLASETEWEYLARAGLQVANPWATAPREACKHGNLADETEAGGLAWANRHACRDGHWFASPVGAFRANDFGVFDVLGNVWEWVEDCWNPGYAGTPTDDRTMTCGDCARRVLRGGAWNTRPESVRFAYRGFAPTGRRAANIGFRVARDLD